MTRDDALELLRSRAVDSFELTADELLEDRRLVDDLGVDSLALVELVLDLEDELGVELPSDEVAQAPTLGALADLVVARTAAKTSAG